MESGTFTHYLDDSVIPEPNKTDEFIEELERSFDLRLIAVQYPNTVTFTGGGYRILRDIYEAGLCASMDYRCEFACGGRTYIVARGQINISDVTWNLNKCEADVKIADDGFGARINNNKSIKVSMKSPLSKNGAEIGACPSVDLEVFDPDDPEPDYLVDTAVTYDWLEAMNHIVRFITDDIITVESTWYDSLPESEKYVIAYGREVRLRDDTSEAPQVSFTDHFESLWKKYNLWAIVRRNDNGTPILDIVQDDDSYGGDVAKSFPWQDDLQQSVDLERMYSSVSVGDKDAVKDENGAYWLPFLPMMGFVNEQYYIEGTCNTDSELDLTSNYLYDTNNLGRVAIGSDEFDKKILLIQYTPYNSRATKGDYLFPFNNPYLYNEQLLNLHIANRWRLQAAGVTSYDAQQANFNANTTALIPCPVYTSPNDTGSDADTEYVLQFDDDFTPPNYFDNDNAWGNGTPPGTPVSSADSRYTAPSVGYYVFSGGMSWELISSNVGAQAQGTVCQKSGYLQIRVSRYNSGNTLISTDYYTSDEQNIPGIYSMTWTHATLMDANDYIIVYSRLWSTAVNTVCPGAPFAYYVLESRLYRKGFFGTVFVATGGGDITGSGPDEYRTVDLKFDRFIAIEDWVTLRDNPTRAIEVATDATSMRIGHASKVSRNILTGETNWELVANRNQTFK